MTPRTAKRKASTSAATPGPSKKRAIAEKPTNPTSPFDKLPDELLLEILEELFTQYGEDWKDYFAPLSAFRNLALTNRRWNRLAVPYLYRVYDNEMGSPAKFMRTLVQAPELVARLDTLHWEYDSHEESHIPQQEKYKPSSSELRDFRAAMRRIDFPRSGPIFHAHIKQFEKHDRMGLLASALLFLPNLRFLEVADNNMNTFYKFRPLWLHSLASAAKGRRLGNVHMFEHLRVLRIQMGGLLLEDISAVLALPSLRRVNVVGCVQPGLDRWRWKCPPRASPIEALSITHSYVDSEAVVKLLDSCRGLQSVYLDFSKDAWEMKGQWGFGLAELSYPIISDGLRQHKDTLRHFTLADDTDNYDPWAGPDGKGIIGTFEEFEQLEFLNLTLSSIIPDDFDDDNFEDGPPGAIVDTLPHNLEALRLRLDNYDTELTLFCLEVLGDALPNFPSLSWVHLEYDPADFDADIREDDKDTLRDLFHSAGVHLCIHSVRHTCCHRHATSYSSEEDEFSDSELEEGFSDTGSYDFDAPELQPLVPTEPDHLEPELEETPESCNPAPNTEPPDTSTEPAAHRYQLRSRH